jgi:ABC-type multidrug transport system ATPase subunit
VANYITSRERSSYQSHIGGQLAADAKRREQLAQREKMGFDLNNYETVAERLVRWWVAYPEGQILTSVHYYDSDVVLFRAEGFNNDGKLIATGYAEEIRGSSPVNKTSHVENGETSAIGRMIQNSPVASNGERPSREEMEKVSRGPQTRQTTVSERPSASGGPSEHIPRGAFATPKQIGYIKKLAKDAGLDDLRLLELIQRELNSDEAVLELLKSHEASKIIEVLK